VALRIDHQTKWIHGRLGWSQALEEDTTVSSGEKTYLYAEQLLEAYKEADVSLVTALPESLLKNAYRMLAADKDIRYVPVTNEGEMPGIAAGAYLGGTRTVMMMENSGLRQMCEPLSRFTQSHNMPLVMMMAYRGEFGEYNWWGHTHAQTMEPLLNALRIPYRFIREIDEIKPMVKKAWIHADSSQLPVALIMTGQCVERAPYATV
jgi:sulfopyruvate decarboxylase subunit alpha